MAEIPDDVDAGQAAYTKFALAIYDPLVLWLSNNYIWKCPTAKILQFYNQHIRANHLDVGVGTGYFLDRCTFTTPSPRIALMDLNTNCLEVAAKRIKRYSPEKYCCNILQPITVEMAGFDSIAVNYVLHCLPGTMGSKAVVWQNLKKLLNQQGVLFGSTLLSQGVERSSLARSLMNAYNKKRIFCNEQDDLSTLKQGLQENFSQSSVEVIGCVALFAAHNS